MQHDLLHCAQIFSKFLSNFSPYPMLFTTLWRRTDPILLSVVSLFSIFSPFHPQPLGQLSVFVVFSLLAGFSATAIILLLFADFAFVIDFYRPRLDMLTIHRCIEVDIGKNIDIFNCLNIDASMLLFSMFLTLKNKEIIFKIKIFS